jgi:hypothetical protein
MEAQFTVDRTETIDLGLANWVFKPEVSRWALRYVELARLPAQGT